MSGCMAQMFAEELSLKLDSASTAAKSSMHITRNGETEMKNLKEAHEILAEALKGRTTQYHTEIRGWSDVPSKDLLYFLHTYECRTNPESKPDIVRYCHVPMEYASLEEATRYGADMFRYVVDGKTGNVKSVEVV